MKILSRLFAVILLTGLLSSCHSLSDIRIEKRHYRKGFYVHVRPHRYTEPVVHETQTTVVAQQQVQQKTEPAMKTYSHPEPPVAVAAEYQPVRSVQNVPANRHK